MTMVFLAGLSSFASSLVPLLWYRNGIRKSTLHVLLGVSAGILFAVATIDLIPEGIAVSSIDRSAVAHAASDAHKDEGHAHSHEDHRGHPHAAPHDTWSEYGRTVTMVGVGTGFLALVVLEHVMMSLGVGHSHGPDDLHELDTGHEHSHHTDDHAHSHDDSSVMSESFSLTAFAAIAVHSLVDGIVIGGSFRVSANIGSRVAVAIVMHKIPDGFVVSSLLAATKRSRKMLWITALSSVTPVGAMLGYAVLTGIPSSVLGGVLGFAAGTFLFICACGIVPELLHAADSPQKSRHSIAALIAGYFLIVVVNLNMAHAH